MRKIKDRITLSMAAGIIGAISGLIVDSIFYFSGKSKRSWPTTAAGIWVSSRKDAESLIGQLLGITMAIGMSMLGSFSFVNLLCKYGRDKILLKGLFFGMSFSSMIHATIGGIVNQKLKPTDAISNFSYLLSGSIYGLATAVAASQLGHESLFDAPPKNDYIKPTEKTSEELKPQQAFAAK